MPLGVRVFLVVDPVDLRASYYRLAAHVRGHLNGDPRSGDLFVFLGKRGSLVKILFWDRTGFCVFAKRLERGLFKLPSSLPTDVVQHEVDFATLTLILEGIELAGARKRRNFEPLKF